MTYDIVTQPWLYVINKNSQCSRLGFYDALEQGKHLNLAYPNPIDRISVFRFILAALYWCEMETQVKMDKAKIPQAWLKFLLESRHLFEFLGEGKRFLQVPGLSRRRPITELFHEVPLGNNFWHFKHVRDYTMGCCTHCAVTGTMRLPLFCVSGRPDMKSGINGSPPIFAIKWGKSLWETIILNWRPREPLGQPVWAEPYRYNPDDDVPLLSGMTVPARLLYVEAAIPTEQACGICGEAPGSLHYTCKFETAGTLENPTWQDPFALRNKDEVIKASDISGTKKLRFDAKIHRLLPHVLNSMDLNGGENVLLVGFASDKAKFVDIWEKSIRIPDIDLANLELTALEEWNHSINSCAANTYLGKIKTKGKDRLRVLKDAVSNDLLPDAETKAGRYIPQILGDDSVWDQVSNQYSVWVNNSARVLTAGLDTRHLRDRKDIERFMPKPRLDNKEDADKGSKTDE
ncbi:MAG: type I-E CRISPR-associated protein Cse1/CasA [Candidatus Cloacimonadaceae bacterium]|jgi:hypothetical protein|nr:type I-E CRISPR-associated protein Cse1/CasA [Candidatus Cloacimonadota bacterium]MDY0319906.1 type I-E CRISPR-associated protein Cse1/CasA [Candidatus Cloacimonadaceae bacterium]